MNLFGRKRLLSLFLLLLGISFPVALSAQSDEQPAPSGSSLSYLQQTFPKLTNLYKEELSNCHTHYIFAVDVSGSMVKHDEIVTPSLQAFVNALPVGEQVSVIPFGTDAKGDTPGLCCKIEGASQKQVLRTALSSLYTSDSYTPDFKRNTDVGKAVEAVSNTILKNQDVKMNVVVIITDFLNDLPGKGEVKLEDALLEQLNKNYDNVTDGCYSRVVALKLPPAGSGKGYCLDQLQEKVFCNTGITKRFDIVEAIKDQAAISHWFEQLSRDIMTEKLRAVIQLDNERNLRPSLKTDIDINGNTTAEIHWQPNKLYREIKIDSTYTDEGTGYYFENNKEAWQTSSDTALYDINLGQLKHESWGLRKYNTKLNIGLSLPTPYDEELKKLSIDKPIPATSAEQKGWLWTFFLSFWPSIIIAVLILYYIISVIKAIMRNGKERFKGTVDFSDHRGKDIGDTIKVKLRSGKPLLIGNGGTDGCDLLGVAWTVKVVKKTSSPLLPWKRPAFEWSAKNGYVHSSKKKRGLLGRYGKNNAPSHVTIDCGSDSEHITHSVKIVIK